MNVGETQKPNWGHLSLIQPQERIQNLIVKFLFEFVQEQTRQQDHIDSSFLNFLFSSVNSQKAQLLTHIVILFQVEF